MNNHLLQSWVRSRMQERGLTPVSLARETGLAKSIVWRMTHDKCGCRVDTLHRIISVLQKKKPLAAEHVQGLISLFGIKEVAWRWGPASTPPLKNISG